MKWIEKNHQVWCYVNNAGLEIGSVYLRNYKYTFAIHENSEARFSGYITGNPEVNSLYSSQSIIEGIAKLLGLGDTEEPTTPVKNLHVHHILKAS